MDLQTFHDNLAKDDDYAHVLLHPNSPNRRVQFEWMLQPIWVEALMNYRINKLNLGCLIGESKSDYEMMKVHLAHQIFALFQWRIPATLLIFCQTSTFFITTANVIADS